MNRIKRLITEARLRLEEAYEVSSDYYNRDKIEKALKAIIELENSPMNSEEE